MGDPENQIAVNNDCENFGLFTYQTRRDNSNISKQVFFSLFLLIDEEILRLKKERKQYQIII